MFDDNNNPKSTPNMIPIIPNIIPWIKNIPTIWFLLAPSDMRIAISFSLFLMDINKDETILNAAITMTNIKIIKPIINLLNTLQQSIISSSKPFNKNQGKQN